jgi:hypothetical protein
MMGVPDARQQMKRLLVYVTGWSIRSFCCRMNTSQPRIGFSAPTCPPVSSPIRDRAVPQAELECELEGLHHLTWPS